MVDAQTEELLAQSPSDSLLGEYVSALGYAGIVHIVLARRPVAERVVRRLRELDPSLGDDHFACGHSAYWQMRFLEMLGDDPYATLRLAQRAAQHNERAGNRRMLAVTWASLGACVRHLHAGHHAEGLMRDAVELVRQVGEPISWSFVQPYLANLLAELGSDEHLDEADALALEAIELAGDGNTYRSLALTARSLVAVRRGELDRAEQHAREAHRLVRTIHLCGYYPQVDATLLQALLARGDVRAALEVAEDSDRVLTPLRPLGLSEMSLRLWTARARRAGGRVVEAATDVAAALACLERRAEAIGPADLRRDFLTRVEEHVALYALGRKLGVDTEALKERRRPGGEGPAV